MNQKRRTKSIAMIVAAATIMGLIVAYSYSVEQTKQKGLQFGIELERIQSDLKDLQSTFYSEKTKWEEGGTTKEHLLEFYDDHIAEFEQIVARYDHLEPPESFEGSVHLLKISSQTQLESDIDFIEWIKTGNETAKSRSDAGIQEALEYEMLGLVDFYSAKTGFKSYYDDEPGEFEPPESDLIRKVNMVTDYMTDECDKLLLDDEQDNEPSAPYTDIVNTKWTECIAKAQEWKKDHLP